MIVRSDRSANFREGKSPVADCLRGGRAVIIIFSFHMAVSCVLCSGMARLCVKKAR